MLDTLSIEAAADLSPDENSYPRGAREMLLGKIERGEMAPYWSLALDHYEINFMLIGTGIRLHLLLSNRDDLGWVKVYEDSGYAIYVRDTAKNKPLIEEASKLSQRIQSNRLNSTRWYSQSPAGK